MSPLTCLSCNPPKVGFLSCDCMTPRIANVKGAKEPLAKDLARYGITLTSTRPFYLQKVNALSLQSAPLTGTMTGTMTGCHCSVGSAHGKAPGGTSVQIVRAARQEILLPLVSLVGGARQIKTYPLSPFPFSSVNSEFSQSSIGLPTQPPTTSFKFSTSWPRTSCRLYRRATNLACEENDREKEKKSYLPNARLHYPFG